MAFTYDASLGTDLSKVRRAIADTVENSGPLPSGTSFTDAELGHFITTEGSWQKAVAMACETLANAWATAVSFKADGLSVDQGKISEAWLNQAKDWRERYGGTTRSGSSAVTRKDGFSDDVTSTE